jgi:hypothetical protein
VKIQLFGEKIVNQKPTKNEENQQLSRSTIGIYLRPLRSIFNEAIADGIIKKEKCYPFGKRKYQIPTSKKQRKHLNWMTFKRSTSMSATRNCRVKHRHGIIGFSAILETE